MSSPNAAFRCMWLRTGPIDSVAICRDHPRRLWPRPVRSTPFRRACVAAGPSTVERSAPGFGLRGDRLCPPDPRDPHRHHDRVGKGVLEAEGASDGHATDDPGVLLAVTVADCVPVYVLDADAVAVALLPRRMEGTAAGILHAASLSSAKGGGLILDAFSFIWGRPSAESVMRWDPRCSGHSA